MNTMLNSHYRMAPQAGLEPATQLINSQLALPTELLRNKPSLGSRAASLTEFVHDKLIMR